MAYTYAQNILAEERDVLGSDGKYSRRFTIGINIGNPKKIDLTNYKGVRNYQTAKNCVKLSKKVISS